MTTLHTSAAPPGQPRTVSMENVGATWVQITWEPPFVVEFLISSYEIIAQASDDFGEIIRNMPTPDNKTFVNVTNLLPGTTYNFTVVAVTQGGDVIARGPESLPLQDVSTEFTGECSSARYYLYNVIYMSMQTFFVIIFTPQSLR